RFDRHDLAEWCRASGSLGSERNVIVFDSHHPSGAGNAPLCAIPNEPAGMSRTPGFRHDARCPGHGIAVDLRLRVSARRIEESVAHHVAQPRARGPIAINMETAVVCGIRTSVERIQIRGYPLGLGAKHKLAGLPLNADVPTTGPVR